MKFTNLDVGFEFPILKNLNGTLTGGITFLLGPNGSGKTTLLKTLSEIIEPLDGEIISDSDVIFLTTDPKIQDGITGNDLLDLYQTKNSKWDTKNLLEYMDAKKLLSVPFERLSSGERQRVLVCAVLLNKAPLAIMDEPLSHLDWNYSLKLKKVIIAQSKLGRKFFISNHDLNWALSFTDDSLQTQTWVLHNQSIFLKGSTESVLGDIKLQDVFKVKIEIIDSKKKLVSFSEL